MDTTKPPDPRESREVNGSGDGPHSGTRLRRGDVAVPDRPTSSQDRWKRWRGTSQWKAICSTCSPGVGGRQYRVRSDVQARLVGELGASVCQRPPTRHPPPALWITITQAHFHHTGCRISGISDWWRIRLRRRRSRFPLPRDPLPTQIRLD